MTPTTPTPPPGAPQLLSAERRTQVIKRACLSPHIANADIDAINSAFDVQEQQAAFRQQVTQELQGLLRDPYDLDDLFATRRTDTVRANERILVAAARLGLSLPPHEAPH